METVKTIAQLLTEAGAKEKESAFDDAADLYHSVLKADKLNQDAYDRLMIVYRKQKDYKNELKTIDAGIKAYQQFYQQKSPHNKNKKVRELSNALMKSTGLADKKGNELYTPEPIARWEKRKLQNIKLSSKKIKPLKKARQKSKSSKKKPAKPV